MTNLIKTTAMSAILLLIATLSFAQIQGVTVSHKGKVMTEVELDTAGQRA